MNFPTPISIRPMTGLLPFFGNALAVGQRLLRLLLVLTMAGLARADQFGDFTFTSDGSAVTITDYTGTGGAVSIPSTINALPVRTIGYQALMGKFSLISVIIPASVTRIGDYAFNDCAGLTSVNIPSSVTSIGIGAFGSCAGLTSVTIPSSVTSIGDVAFWLCTGLTSVTIPSGVTSIGDGAFGGCAGLTSVNIPSSVTSIGDGAFVGCAGLTSVTIPSSLTTIVSNAFANCTGLTSVTISASVTSIGDSAFNGCTGLTSVNIPSSVTSIGDYAFNGCTGLTTVTIPTGVTSIGSSAFSRCTALTSVYCEGGPPSIGSNVFTNASNATIYYMPSASGWGTTFGGLPTAVFPFTYAESQGQVTITYYTGSGGMVIIPSTINGQPVKTVGNSAFFDIAGLTSVTIPSSVTSIDDFAFWRCTGLTSVTIPSSVTSIGDFAFSYCTGLTTVTIPASVTSIGRSAFRICTGLTSVTIPASVTSIGESAFNGCPGLTSVYCEGGPPSIGLDVFTNANATVYYMPSASGWGTTFGGRPTALFPFTYAESSGEVTITGYTGTGATVIIPSAINGQPVKTVGVNAFADKTGVTSVTIPSSVTSIGRYVFNGCTGLTAITVDSANTSYSSLDIVLFNKTLTDLIAYPGGKTGAYNIPASVTSIGDSAFDGCTGLTSVTIPSGVTSIGAWAFYNCRGLTSVSLPASLTNIGDFAFRCCTGLTSVTIPSGVTSIGDNLFSDCTGLTSVTIPSSVTNIGEYAFTGCIRLTSVTIPSGVTSIGVAAFSDCTGLASVTIPPSVTSIGDYAFINCTGLTSVAIPSGVTSIGDSAFNFCTGLTSVTIPSSVTSIGDWAFWRCTGLTSVTIHSGVTSIGESAFSLCTGLTSVTIPSSVTSIEREAFAYCTGVVSAYCEGEPPSIVSDVFAGTNATVYYMPSASGWGTTFGGRPTALFPFESISDGSAVTITEYTGTGGAVIIPSTINGQPVKTLGDYAFSDKTSMTSVTIPVSVTRIGNGAFSDCTGLTSVTIPANVTIIGYYAFVRCTGLMSVTIPASVISIDSGTFEHCTGLTSVTIAASVTSIGHHAFAYCTGLTSVTIPASVTHIGSGAFGSCTGLTAITVDAANPNYSHLNGVLINKALTTLIQYPGGKAGAYILPASVTSIDDFAFDSCTGLTSVTIPVSVTSIGDYAFEQCTGLTSVTIPVSVTSIGSGAFSDCTGLTSVTIPVNVTRIAHGVFRSCTRLASVTIPASVTSIDDFAFYSCTGLTSVTIPASVTSIGQDAFAYCSGLTSVTIPASVTSIGDYAFYSCTGLTSVKFLGNAPGSVGSDIFYNAPNVIVYRLAAASGWGATFADRPVAIFSVTATVTLGNLSQTYTGTARTATATTNPAGLNVSITYNGSSTPPVNAGSYSIVATVNDATYSGTATGTLTVAKASATVTLGGLAQTYNGSTRTATATTNPAGLSVSFTYNGSANAPTAAGSYTVVATINNTNYAGTNTGTLTVAKATATVNLGSLAQTYNGSARTATATTSPVGLTVAFTYNGSPTAPVNVGNYAVVATVADPNFTAATASGTLVVSKATATVALGSLAQTYTGAARTATATTSPAGLNVTFTYNSSATAPVNAGNYSVVATANDANHTGTASGTLAVSKASQQITFATIPNQTLDPKTVTLTATASSGLTPVLAVVSGPATVSAQILTITGPGPVVVRATQVGNSNWNAATPEERAFHVFAGDFQQDFVWAKGFGGGSNDNAAGVAVDASGNAWVAGDFTGAVSFGSTQLTAAGGSDLALLKMASDGTVLSAFRYGGTSADSAKAVAVDAAGNAIMAAEFSTGTQIGASSHTSAGSKDIVLLKVDATGAVAWSSRFGGVLADSVYGLAVDAAGNIYLAGDFSGSIAFGGTTLTSGGGRDGYVAKLNGATGAALWALKIGGTGTGNDTTFALAAMPDGRVLVGGAFSGTADFGGQSRTSAGGTDGFLMAMSNAGAVQWVTRFGGVNNDVTKAVAVDVTGATCAAGSYAGTDVTFGLAEALAYEGGDDIFVARFSAATGGVLNVEHCGGTGADAALALAADSFGAIYLSGSYSGTANFGGLSLETQQLTNGFVAKLSVGGGFQWAMDVIGAAEEKAASLAVNAGGHVFVSGIFSQAATLGTHPVTGGGQLDMFVAKINGPVPSFGLAPAPVFVDLGDPFSITATATGADPVNYQWFKNGVAVEWETTPALSVAAAAAVDSGSYHLVATNAYGSGQLPAVAVTVRTPVRTLSFEAPTATQENRVIEVPVYLDSHGEVTGISFEVAYNPAYLSNPLPVYGSQLTPASTTVTIDKVAGKVRVVGTAGVTSFPTGRQSVFMLRFTTRSVPAGASATITPTLLSISDGAGASLPGYTKVIGSAVSIAQRTIPGDANNNARLDVSDAAEVIRLYANPTQIRTWDVWLNDLNTDSALTEGDATRVLRAVALLDPVPSFPQNLPAFAPPPEDGVDSPSTGTVEQSVSKRAPRNPAPPVAGSARLVLTRLTGADANKVLARVHLDDVASGQAGLAFKVDYPASVLRIAGASSLGSPVGGLPSGVAPTWNVLPGNNYAAQTGTVMLSAAWGSSWTFANGQAVASIVFEVQPLNSAQSNFPISLSAVEAAPHNPDGPSTPQAISGQTVPFSRTYADWALATLGNAAASATADPDRDGQSNGAEFAASTNPLNAQSRLVTLSAGLVPSGYKLRWFAAYGVTYRVRWSSDLKNWNILGSSSVVGTGAESEVTDPNPPAGTRFYRIETVPTAP